MKLFLLFFLFQCISAFALEKIITNQDYNQAKANQEYLKFLGESTKFGLVTTSFDGYVKTFKMTYDKVNDVLKNSKVVFEVKAIDTDSDSRNEKMWDLCLEATKFPTIYAEILSEIKLLDGQYEVPINLKIKETTLKKNLKIVVKNESQFVKIKGTTSILYSEYKIADPSIAIAKVRDRFDLEFEIFITK